MRVIYVHEGDVADPLGFRRGAWRISSAENIQEKRDFLIYPAIRKQISLFCVTMT